MSCKVTPLGISFNIFVCSEVKCWLTFLLKMNAFSLIVHFQQAAEHQCTVLKELNRQTMLSVFKKKKKEKKCCSLLCSIQVCMLHLAVFSQAFLFLRAISR